MATDMKICCTCKQPLPEPMFSKNAGNPGGRNLECKPCHNAYAKAHFPLRGHRVSGLHVENNLRVIPATENIRKQATFQGEHP